MVHATTAPTEFLGLSEESGGVSEGMRADLVILESNPLDDLQTLRKPVAVVEKGRVLDAEALEGMRDRLLRSN